LRADETLKFFIFRLGGKGGGNATRAQGFVNSIDNLKEVFTEYIESIKDKDEQMQPQKAKYNSRDLLPIYESIKVLLEHDEIERALWLCDNVPAFWRANPTEELIRLKTEIQRLTVTPYWYSSHDQILGLTKDTALGFITHILRGHIMSEEIRVLNEKGITPHLVDMGPGEFHMAYGLHLQGRKFTYKGLSLIHPEFPSEFKEFQREKPEDGQKVIFVANEIIEHLADVSDIRKEQLRFAPTATSIHLSTPMYAFAPNEDWTKKDLGHLRAYTPFEFQLTATKLFPEFIFRFYEGEVMSLIGEKKT